MPTAYTASITVSGIVSAKKNDQFIDVTRFACALALSHHLRVRWWAGASSRLLPTAQIRRIKFLRHDRTPTEIALVTPRCSS